MVDAVGKCNAGLAVASGAAAISCSLVQPPRACARRLEVETQSHGCIVHVFGVGLTKASGAVEE